MSRVSDEWLNATCCCDVHTIELRDDVNSRGSHNGVGHKYTFIHNLYTSISTISVSQTYSTIYTQHVVITSKVKSAWMCIGAFVHVVVNTFQQLYQVEPRACVAIIKIHLVYGSNKSETVLVNCIWCVCFLCEGQQQQHKKRRELSLICWRGFIVGGPIYDSEENVVMVAQTRQLTCQMSAFHLFI